MEGRTWDDMSVIAGIKEVRIRAYTLYKSKRITEQEMIPVISMNYPAAELRGIKRNFY